MAKSSKTVLCAGVAGAGVFGGYHSRKYAEADGVSFKGVFDTSLERAAQVAAPFDAQGFGADDFEAFLDGLDVLTLATPAVTHAKLASAALARGIAVYSEKPLATTLEDGRAMVEAARRVGKVLACGHQERGVFAAMGILNAPEPLRKLYAVRNGPFSGRCMDVSVVLDLMVHDLDLVLALDPGVRQSLAVEAGFTRGDLADTVKADLSFADGLEVQLIASRDAAARERTMTLTYDSGVVHIDFVARTFENSTGFALNADFADTPAGRDPLAFSVGAFLDAVRGDVARPLVTSEEALAALDLALAIEAETQTARA